MWLKKQQSIGVLMHESNHSLHNLSTYCRLSHGVVSYDIISLLASVLFDIVLELVLLQA